MLLFHIFLGEESFDGAVASKILMVDDVVNIRIVFQLIN